MKERFPVGYLVEVEKPYPHACTVYDKRGERRVLSAWSKPVWQSGGTEYYCPCEMEYRHLINVVKYLQGWVTDRAKLQLFEEHLALRRKNKSTFDIDFEGQIEAARVAFERGVFERIAKEERRAKAEKTLRDLVSRRGSKADVGGGVETDVVGTPSKLKPKNYGEKRRMFDLE